MTFLDLFSLQNSSQPPPPTPSSPPGVVVAKHRQFQAKHNTTDNQTSEADDETGGDVLDGEGFRHGRGLAGVAIQILGTDVLLFGMFHKTAKIHLVSFKIYTKKEISSFTLIHLLFY